MVKRENVNCVAVEWKQGVKTRYAQAANNIRVVAAQVAAMITFLMVNHGRSATSHPTSKQRSGKPYQGTLCDVAVAKQHISGFGFQLKTSLMLSMKN